MATALDFAAMLAQERARARRELSRDRSAPAVPVPADPPDVGSGAKRVAPTVLGDVHYARGYLSRDEEEALVTAIDGDAGGGGWAELGGRRLKNLGGTPHPDGMVPEEAPEFLGAVVRGLVGAGVFPAGEPPNHCLLNEYARGEGIAPHQDGPLYDDTVAIVSLLGPCLIQFWSARPGGAADPPLCSVLLEPRSLLVFSGDAYARCWHGIDAVAEDTLGAHTANAASLVLPGGGAAAPGSTWPRAPRRLSLTVRRVRRVVEADSLRFETPEGRAERARKERWWLASRSEHATAGR